MLLHLAPGKGIGFLGKLIGAVCHLFRAPGKAVPEAAFTGGCARRRGFPLLRKNLLRHIPGIAQFGCNLFLTLALPDSLVKELLVVPDNIFDLIKSQLSPQRQQSAVRYTHFCSSFPSPFNIELTSSIISSQSSMFFFR